MTEAAHVSTVSMHVSYHTGPNIQQYIFLEIRHLTTHNASGHGSHWCVDIKKGVELFV